MVPDSTYGFVHFAAGKFTNKDCLTNQFPSFFSSSPHSGPFSAPYTVPFTIPFPLLFTGKPRIFGNRVFTRLLRAFMEGKIPRTESISHLPGSHTIYTIVEIIERGLTPQGSSRNLHISTIVEIKERGLTLSARKGNTISSLLKDSLSGKNASSSPLHSK